MERILRGKAVKDRIVEDLSKRSEAVRDRGVFPALAIVRVGEDPADISYERGAMKTAMACGIMARQFVYDEDISQDDLIREIEKLNEDPYIHGVLMFRPLPSHMDERAVCESLAPEKDMDGITSGSLAGVFMGTGDGYPPCTAQACIEMLDHYGIDLEGKKVTVYGRSLVVGRPIAVMAMGRNATVTVCHSRTPKEDFAAAGKNADVIISAVGRARMIGDAHIGEDQVVLDVGINVDDEGKLCGDVDFDAVSERCAGISPVPGGLGAVTTAVLMRHVIEAAEKSVR